MSDQARFYYVIEHATGTVRAAQSTLRDAQRYTTADNCHERFIAGPMTADELHRLGLGSGGALAAEKREKLHWISLYAHAVAKRAHAA